MSDVTLPRPDTETVQLLGGERVAHVPVGSLPGFPGAKEYLETIPGAEFRVDPESPYLETVTVDQDTARVVSAQGLRDYAETIVPSSRTAMLKRVIDAVSLQLYPETQPHTNLPPDVAVAKRVAEKVWFLGSRRDSNNNHRRMYHARWGIEPEAFVGVLNLAKRGDIKLDCLNQGALTAFIIANYVSEISKK